MKKITVILFMILLALVLVSCSSDKSTENDNEKTIEEKTDVENDSEAVQESDPMEAMLKKAGVDLEKVMPDEAVFDTVFDESDEEISFYMEKETEKDTAAYLQKIMEECKAASDDGILYEANLDFYMGTNLTELEELPSAEEINSEYWYLLQYGYLKDGNTVTVTIGSLSDMHPERNDDIYYPLYTLSLMF